MCTSSNTVSTDTGVLQSQVYLVYNLTGDGYEHELEMIYFSIESAREAVKVGKEHGLEMGINTVSANGSFEDAVNKRNADRLAWKLDFDKQLEAERLLQEKKVAKTTKLLETCNLSCKDLKDYLDATGKYTVFAK